jgi:hypothetical protein
MEVTDITIKRWKNPRSELYPFEIRLVHLPSAREVFVRGTDEIGILVEALKQLKRVVAAKRPGKFLLLLNDFMQKLEHHFWCAFFHHRDRCYPGVDKPYPWNTWHCARCHSCGEAIDWVSEKPIRGAFGWMYIRPIKD